MFMGLLKIKCPEKIIFFISKPTISAFLRHRDTLKILFVWHCWPTLAAGGSVGRIFFFFFFYIWKPLRHYFRFSRPFSILCRLNVCSQYSVHQALLRSRFEINKAQNKLRGHDQNSDAIPILFVCLKRK